MSSFAKTTIAVDGRMAACSGIGVYLRNTLRLLALHNPEWSFLVYGWPAGAPGLEGLDNIEHVDLSAKIYSLKEQIAFPLALEDRVSAVLVPHYNIPILTQKPLFVTVHDVTHLAEPTAAGGWHRRAYAKLLFEAVRRKARCLFFVSEFSRREFRTYVGDFSCPSFIVSNAAAAVWRNAADSVLKRPLSRRYLIYVGNIKPHKNLGRLLSAFELLSPIHDVDLVIVGKKNGFLHGDSEVFDRASKLGDRVHFTGAISDSELIAWVAHAEALVFPSLYEGFGIPPLEAMTVSCPTIVSDLPPVREACGDASEYVNPLDVADIARGITKVLTDPHYACRLREAGRKRVVQFDFANAAEVIGSALRANLRRPLTQPHKVPEEVPCHK
jgi:glycosyltransferase involved in cell wall biosynthesis